MNHSFQSHHAHRSRHAPRLCLNGVYMRKLAAATAKSGRHLVPLPNSLPNIIAAAGVAQLEFIFHLRN